MSDEHQANELYWNSEQSVNSIADELGLSKGRLYDAVRPLPAGNPCPSCGSELVYENRTARDRRTAACPSCGAEATGSSTPAPAAASDGSNGGAPSPDTARILIGAAIGGAVGLLIVRWLRR